MIRISDDWVVDVDEYNYTLRRDLHKKINRRNPNGTVDIVDGYKTKGYFSNLESALNKLFDAMVTEKLKDIDCDLEEAIEIIKSCADEWREITRKILEV